MIFSGRIPVRQHALERKLSAAWSAEVPRRKVNLGHGIGPLRLSLLYDENRQRDKEAYSVRVVARLFRWATSRTVNGRNSPEGMSNVSEPNCTRLIFSTLKP